jgi:hypothetical protein
MPARSGGQSRERSRILAGMATEPHREYCRRQHRVLGHYLSIEAWRRGLDCIALERADLEVLLGLKRFKDARIQWLRHDLQPWFPHQKSYKKTKAPSSLHSLFLARVPIQQYLSNTPMTTVERVKAMGAGAPKTGRFFGDAGVTKRPTEEEIVSRLALLTSGLLEP